jgi:prepilin-type N-terminal cleavage/methylation domain-containing protein
MKLPALNPVATGRKFRQGFTLVEIMTVMAIFVMMVGAMVSLQIFGLRVYTLAATKISATTSGRETLNNIRDRIRSAQVVYVGTYSNSAFSQASLGTAQQGNAIQILSTTTVANTITTNAIVFYMDPTQYDGISTNVMKMVSSGAETVVAKFMTNYYCFQAEDYKQAPLTDYKDNTVIHVTMQFYQWEYPIGCVGGTGINAYDYYCLNTRISRRTKS